MRKLLLSIAIVISSPIVTSAQSYATCSFAGEVNFSTFGPVRPSGAKDKYVTKKHSNGLYFEQTHNITWLSFVVPNDTILTFDLIPQDPKDNLDFLVFRDEAFFCKEIERGGVQPIRANVTKIDTAAHNSYTGLSASAKDTVVSSPDGPGYSKGIPVKKGERYYIVVDNCTEGKGGFVLLLHLNFPKYTPPVASEDRTTAKKETSPEKDNVKNIDAAPFKVPPIKPANPTKPLVKGKTMLDIVVSDTNGSPVKAELDITGVKAAQVINADTVEYGITLSPRQTINVNCNALGYMFSQTSFTAPDSGGNITLPIRLERVEEHKSFILKDIKFSEGNAIFLASAQNELMNLLEFMKNNPDVNILIKGYVNDPGSDNSGAAKKLSKQRAEAVKAFLVTAGIDKKRMDYKGFGNEHMLFPNPANEAQAQANRRVEVEIIK